MSVYDVPDLLRHRATLLGASGERWLANLDGLLREIEKEWQLEIEAQLTGGTEALVFCATQAGGDPAVLKVGLPPSLVREARTLELAGGVGYASLLAFDASRGAMLLERLGEKLADMGTSAYVVK